jgi:hypothetical protein
MTNQPQQSFDQWCILELFGRQVIAGRVTEQVIGGCSFIRVDIPEINERLAFTRFYGQGAIYAMTPVSEEVARITLKRFTPEPVNVYVPELKLLEAKHEEIEDEEDETDGHDPSEKSETCGCMYCNCMNETEHGETCSDCLQGAHQG